MLFSDVPGHVPTILVNSSGRTGISIQVHLWPLLFSTMLYTWIQANLLCQHLGNQSV